MRNKLASSLLLIIFLFSTIAAVGIVHTDAFLPRWQLLNDNYSGLYSESNGTLKFYSNASGIGGPTFYRDISPQTDFNFSLQVKASTLGVTGADSNLEGFGIFLRPNSTSFGNRTGVNFELRGGCGGMFLLARFTYTWDWSSFVGGYGEAYGFPFGPPLEPPVNSSVVEANVWYTMDLEVRKEPFSVTGQVFDEHGTLLGTLSVSDMTNFSFQDIKCLAIGSGWGGEFYIKNISGLPPASEFTFSPAQLATHQPVVFDASNSSGTEGQIVNYSWDFGDGTTASTNQSVIQHIYINPGVYNVTLTTFDVDGMNSSSAQTVNVLTDTFLSVTTDVKSATVSSPITIGGRLTDFDGKGLSNRLVVLWYNFPGANSSTAITSSYTDQSGYYSAQWVNLASGTFTVGAQWGGDSAFMAANNSTTLTSLPYKNQNAFFLESNSTVSALAFNSTSSELSFTVSGPSGTKGYTKVTITKTLISDAGDLKAYLDGNQLNWSLAENENTWILTFVYSHSTHQIDLLLPHASLTTTAPSSLNNLAMSSGETGKNLVSLNQWLMPSILAIALLVVACALAVLIKFRSRKVSSGVEN